MKLSDLIKQSVEALAQHGDISVDIEFDGTRRIAKGIDLETSKIGYNGFVLVVVGEEKHSDR